jgi:hypothetical protein
MNNQNIAGYAYTALAVVVCAECAATEPEMNPSEFHSVAVITPDQLSTMHDWCWSCDMETRYWGKQCV